MEFISMLLEFLRKESGLSTSIMFGIILMILSYITATMKKNDAKINKRLDEQETGLQHTRRDLKNSYDELKKELEHMNLVILKNIQEDQLETRKLTLRSIITNNTLPREYRLKSYDEYKDMKGNSWISDYVEKHLIKKQDGE